MNFFPLPIALQIMPRYTSERYSGPPPPYSTAISSTSVNHLTTIAREPVSLVCSSSENSSSSFEVKAHFTERGDGSFVVNESPQRIIQYSEDENGSLSFSEKVTTPPPQVISCDDEDDDIQEIHDNDEDDDDEEEEEEEVSEPIRNNASGLMVLSNVKIESGMIDPGIQEILLKKGKRTSKISNRKPTRDDLAGASSPATEEIAEQIEVMDLTTAPEFDAPSTSQIVDCDEEALIEPDPEVEADDEAKIDEEREITSTPTSVIRTVSECVSPQPSTSSAEHPEAPAVTATSCTTLSKFIPSSTSKLLGGIGRPIVSKPKKLTLKLKSAVPQQQQPVVEVKQEPELRIDDTAARCKFPCIVKVESKADMMEEQSQLVVAEEMVVEGEDKVEETPQKEEDAAAASNDMYTDPNTESSYIITYVNDTPTSVEAVHEESAATTGPEDVTQHEEPTPPEEKVQYSCPTIVYQEEVIPLSWVQRFSPQYVPFDERSSYMDLDGFSKHSNASASVQSTSNSYDRAPSTESLNIRTDEKMPAKGEISEQESNGEVDHWNQVSA